MPRVIHECCQQGCVRRGRRARDPVDDPVREPVHEHSSEKPLVGVARRRLELAPRRTRRGAPPGQLGGAEPRREAARSENGGPSRRGQPHRLRVSAQGSVRTGRETIRSCEGRLAGRSAVAAVTLAGRAVPGLPGATDGRWRGPSNSYFEGPRCVAAQGFSTFMSILETRCDVFGQTPSPDVHRSPDHPGARRRLTRHRPNRPEWEVGSVSSGRRLRAATVVPSRTPRW
jgi:hypothetical protein